MLVLCLNVYKLYDDGFLVHYNACHVCFFTKYSLSNCVLKDSQRKVKYSTEVVTEAT